MQVMVRYFAVHREATGLAEEFFEIPDGATVGELVDQIIARHPTLADLRRDTVVSVNRGVGTEGMVLKPDDDVALFPPISGG
jgi:molybdopterin converting factor subunit 1